MLSTLGSSIKKKFKKYVSCTSNFLDKIYNLDDKAFCKVIVKKVKFYFFLLILTNYFYFSTKFWRKLVYVKSLDELSQYVTALEKAAIPEKVKQYDSKKH